MQKLHRATADEVIGEFLKNEYFHSEYHRDRCMYESMVMNPDLSSSAENAARRRLLYRRRADFWRELPADTQWWLVGLESSDIQNIRILPRGHWGKMTDKKSPYLKDVVEGIRRHTFPSSTSRDVAIIQSLYYRFPYDRSISSVMLIGIDEKHDFTILEGNHRLAAGLLASDNVLQNRFRFYAGLSARMCEYWLYDNNYGNLCLHLLNRLRRAFLGTRNDADSVSQCFPSAVDENASD